MTIRYWPYPAFSAPFLPHVFVKWLRGRDLNPRPLGYEDYLVLSRLFQSTTYTLLDSPLEKIKRSQGYLFSAYNLCPAQIHSISIVEVQTPQRKRRSGMNALSRGSRACRICKQTFTRAILLLAKQRLEWRPSSSHAWAGEPSTTRKIP
jgi:hypothetical protein